VLATQNPIEQEGTYPLPEAQLDRFMLNTLIDYPDEDEEFEVVRRTTGEAEARIEPVLDAAEIVALQQIVRRVPVADHVIRFALRLARGTRPATAQQSTPGGGASSMVRRYVSWGAGPRASQYLILGAKARSALDGRFHADIDDVRAVAVPVLRHRVMTNFNAEADGIKPDDVIRELLESVRT
jgi:MoxR-like ATPase